MTDIIDIKSRGKKTVPLPELSLELLKDAPNGWETAVIYPLPANPSYELLEAARLNVLDYLDFYSQSINTDEELLAKTLKLGFEKMHEIAILLIYNPFPVPESPPPPDDPESSA